MRQRGIYAITNTTSNKVYIGSTNSLKKREAYHRGALRLGTHDNPHLQHAWNKYGSDAFEFGVLEYLDDPEQLHLAEQFWMDIYREEDRVLYNCGLVARCPMLGRTMTTESRRKISRANLGRRRTKETRRRISKAKAKPYPAFTHKDTGQTIPAGINLFAMCQERDLRQSCMRLVATGRQTSHKGWFLATGT